MTRQHGTAYFERSIRNDQGNDPWNRSLTLFVGSTGDGRITVWQSGTAGQYSHTFVGFTKDEFNKLADLFNQAADWLDNDKDDSIVILSDVVTQ